MAYEIERKWILPSERLDRAGLKAHAAREARLEQGYVDPADHEVGLEEGVMICAGEKLRLDAGTEKEFSECVRKEGWRKGAVRYRIYDDGRGAVMTVKGRGNPARVEIEFGIGREQAERLRSKSFGIIFKTRYELADGAGVLEIDFYEGKLSGLASIEREFSSEAEASAYRLPDSFLKLGAAEATENRAFKNSRLALDPDRALAEMEILCGRENLL